MRRPIRIAIPLAVLGTLAAAAMALGAVIPIYDNDMSTVDVRSQLRRISGESCARSAGNGMLKVAVGERTNECTLRTPVIGGNLDIVTTARLLPGTPSNMQARVFVAVGVRSGGGGQYQLAVFPRKGSFQLRRDVPPDGQRTLLANGKVNGVKGVSKPNRLRLQVFPTTNGGNTRVKAWLNGRKLASVLEDAHAASTITGRFSTFSVGSDKAADGARASFDDLKVAVPDPF